MLFEVVFQIRIRVNYTEPDAISALSYDTVMILVEAIKKANFADPEKIRDALEIIQVEALLAKYRFSSMKKYICPVSTIFNLYYLYSSITRYNTC